MAIYKRGKVFYMNIVVNGVRIAKSTGKTTRREAKHFEALEREKALNVAKMTPQEKAAKMTFGEAVDIVYEQKWKYGKDAKRSLGRAENLAKLIGRDIQLCEITDDVIAGIVSKLEQKNSAVATINRFYASLKTVLRHHKQPWDHIKLRKERKGRIRTITKIEEQQVLSLLRETNHSKRRYFYYDVADLVEVLLDTGMRLQELLNLTYEDVNFDTNMISIWINKGDRPRSIPMTRRVQMIMKSRNTTNLTKPFDLKPYQSEHAWRWVRKEMGLEKDFEFILHCLRHSCASRLVNKGIDLYVVKEWLGHSTIQVTERYAHLSPVKLVQAARALEDL